MSIGSRKLVHISFVVRDVEKVMKNWETLLGGKAEIWNIPGPDVAPVLTNGKPQLYHNIKLGNIELDDGVIIEAVQPDETDSPWKTFLEEHGEGLMEISFITPDEEEAERTIGKLSGCDKPYHIGYYPGQSYAFYNTWEALATNINIKVNRDNTSVMNEIRRQIKDLGLR